MFLLFFQLLFKRKKKSFPYFLEIYIFTLIQCIFIFKSHWQKQFFHVHQLFLPITAVSIKYKTDRKKNGFGSVNESFLSELSLILTEIQLTMWFGHCYLLNLIYSTKNE